MRTRTSVTNQMRQKRIRESGGFFDQASKHWVLPACAGVPEMAFRDLEEACEALAPRSEAIARATGIQRPQARSYAN